MKRWIQFPKSEGQVARQAHCNLPEGTYEREMGKESFFGPATRVYHTHPPTGWVDWEGPLRPRAFDLARIETKVACPWDATLVLHNAHVKCRWWPTEGAMKTLVRNADGDDLIFVHKGEGDFFCDFGHLSLEPGDYLVVPRGTMWRTEFQGAAVCFLVEATNDSYYLPEKGLLGHQAIFDPGILRTPALDEAFKAQQGEQQWQVRIKRRDHISTVTFPFNPLDAVGWQRDNLPVLLNLRDIRPVTSARYHLPPTVHTTFLASRFAVCSFCPRPLESDPGSLKVPYFHNNDDYDEATFHHAGNFFSRDNVSPGLLTFHPCGFTHGPQPKALAGAKNPDRVDTDEYAVMVETRDALEVGPLPDGVELPDYVNAWKSQPAG